ncbi:2'-5' RNA ligase family protein [Diaminobutyricibacter sp. McL0608]|uniref:2'-5' RNA ligase family protein n=1 Tax=Leifsonia sp. McL0608 TaxID=3143537 RepID=UPI0031F2EE19
MSRVVVVIPLEPLHAGTRFAVREWPLHVTVVPPFSTHATIDDLARAIAETTAGVSAFPVTAGRGALFGRRHDIPVTLVDEDARLTGLHAALTAALHPLALPSSERSFQPGPYRPHVTVKGERRAAEGEVLRLRQVALVDMAPRSSPGGREVLATVELAPAQTG